MKSIVYGEDCMNKIQGKTFVITGALSDMTRKEAQQKIEDAGGHFASSMSKKVDFLIKGEDVGATKMEKAQNLGITIITETIFLNMFNSVKSDTPVVKKGPVVVSQPAKVFRNLDID